jgi:hypothetical protein
MLSKIAGGSRALSALLFLSFILFSRCAGGDAMGRKAYNAEMNRWTRSVKIYDGMVARIYLNATYKTPSFRDAYVERYAKSLELEPDYRAALAEREREVSERFNEFFITVYTPEAAWDDLDRADSVWRLYLETGEGERLSPVSVTRAAPAAVSVLRELFPYFDPWSTAYIVKFPRYSHAGLSPVPSEDTGSIRLVVTGILGKGELEWRLKD